MKLLISPANGFCGIIYTTLAKNLKVDLDVDIIPSFGHSKFYPIVNNWKNQTDELIDFIDKDSKYVAIGHSMGAIILLQAAAQYPQYFEKIFLIDPPIAFGWNSYLFKLIKKMGLQDYFTIAHKLKKRESSWESLDEAKIYFKKTFKNFNRDCLDCYLEYGIIEVNCNNKKIYKPSFQRDIELEFYKNSPDNLNSLKALKKIGVDVILLTPERGSLIPKSSVNSFIKKHSAKHKLIKGSHMSPFEYPEELAKLIKNML